MYRLFYNKTYKTNTLYIEKMIDMTNTLRDIRNSKAVMIYSHVANNLIINQTDLRAYKNAVRSKEAPANSSRQSLKINKRGYIASL